MPLMYPVNATIMWAAIMDVPSKWVQVSWNQQLLCREVW